MHTDRKHDWRDLESLQTGSAFPETPEKEAGGWRSFFIIANKLGPFVLGLWLLGFAATIIFLILQDKEGKSELAAGVLMSLLVFVPIFGGIAWATRRALKDTRQVHKSNTK